jgi:hypothetical protein
METTATEIIAQYGVTGSLLFIMLYWLVKHYLPEHQRQHREELERILLSHDRNTNRMVSALERNTKIVQYNSQALLVQGFTRGGMDRAEAEAIVRRIQFSFCDGNSLAADEHSTTSPKS